MADFSALIAQIEAYVKQNGNNEITGNGLQSILVGMVNALGTVAITALQGDLADEVTARTNADGAINAKIPAEASSSNKLADKAFVTGLTTALQNAVNAIKADIENGYVYAGIATPSGTPVSGRVFYLARQAGTYTNFGGLALTEGVNILKYNGTTWSQEQLISIADIYKNPLMGYYECDTAGGTAAKTVAATGYVLPATGGSVKIKMANRNTVANATLNINSTGAKPLYYNGQRAGVGNTWDTNEIVEVFYDGTNYQAYNVAGSNGDGVFDISAYNLTDGQPTPYVDLSAALGTDGANVPQSLRKGGMSVKFIKGSAQSSDNNYVQFRLMAQSFTTDETKWQGVDDEPMAESENLVKSGGIFESTGLALLQLHGTFVTNNLKDKIALNRAINTNGALANNNDRSLLKIPVLDPSSTIVVTGITLVRYAFCSENPDLYSDSAAGFISATTSRTQPTNIPSNAKYIIYDINTADIGNEVVCTYTNDYFNKRIANPILNNHTNEIRYRGTAQLCWDDVTKKLYWTAGSTRDSSGSMIDFVVANKTVRLGIGNVKEKIFNTSDNAQLLLPLPLSDTSTVMTLDDIVVQSGTTYDKSSYMKLAQIIFGNAISSFVCKKEVKDNVIVRIENNIATVGMGVEHNRLDISALIPGYDYIQNLIVGGNIKEDGTLVYISGRYAVFFKLPEKGVAPTITTDARISAYQWYSGNPEYITGSNSLGRTTSNTPPSNAEYGGLTFADGQPSSIIIVSGSGIGELKTAIGILGTNLNNSVGENCFANGLRTNLKILGYGNSFMRNSVAYLSSIANGCGVNLTVGNLYTGGTELQNHLTALRNNTAEYEWHKYVNGSETQSQNHQTPMRGLLDERWDAIIVHQYIPWQYPFEPTLNQFLKLIIEKIGYTPKIYINATWAGSLDENETYYGYETEEEMWEAMLSYVKDACTESGVQEFSIIPTGTAIQNARTLSWADDYCRFVNASPDLHHLNPAGGFIAACTLYEKIVAPLNGIHCSQTTFRITSSVAMPPSTDVQQGILVTDDNYAALCKCAVDAVNSPYVVTQQ